jgi:hypothetical protein
VTKTNCMLLTNVPSINIDTYVLNIGNDVIERKHFIKFLGIYIDEHLKWHEHINVCKSKLTSSLYAINKVKNIVPVNCLKTLYYSLVYPHITYGIILWGSTYNIHVNKLYVMQKRIIRTMLRTDYNEHSHPLFHQLQLLKLQDIYEIEIAKVMYKYNNHNLPNPLLNNFVDTQFIHGHQTRQYTHLRSLTCRLNTALTEYCIKVLKYGILYPS